MHSIHCASSTNGNDWLHDSLAILLQEHTLHTICRVHCKMYTDAYSPEPVMATYDFRSS